MFYNNFFMNMWQYSLHMTKICFIYILALWIGTIIFLFILNILKITASKIKFLLSYFQNMKITKIQLS